MSPSSRVALAIGLYAFCVWPLRAANLLLNPAFDSNSANWTLQSAGPGAYGGWLATVGRGGTGGLYLTANLGGSNAFAMQCVNMTSATIDAHIYSTPQYSPDNLYYGTVSVSTFNVPDCAATYVSNTVATPHILDDGWVLHRLDGIELPAATQSVALIAQTSAVNGSVSLYWDDAGLGPSGTTGVPPLPANLLLNPDFNFSLFRWQRFTSDDGLVYWQSSTGEPGLGSVAIQRSSGGTPYASQCVRLPGGAIDAHALSAGAAGDPAELAVSFHDGDHCAGTRLGTAIALKSPSPGAWTLHHLLDYIPPAGSVSAQVMLANGGTGTAYMDHAAMGAAGTVGAPSRHRIGGSVSGLAGDQVQLRLNGGEILARSSDGAFTFDTRVLDGGGYAVTIHRAPTDPAQVCLVKHGTGTVSGADVDTVQIDCKPPVRYRVGGLVSGLGGHSLILGLNGIEILPITHNGVFEFGTHLLDGESYVVTVAQQPLDPEQTCSVTGGDGEIIGVDALAIQVQCVTTVFDRLFANDFE